MNEGKAHGAEGVPGYQDKNKSRSFVAALLRMTAHGEGWREGKAHGTKCVPWLPRQRCGTGAEGLVGWGAGGKDFGEGLAGVGAGNA